MVNKENYNRVQAALNRSGVLLVAVSKLKPVEDIMTLYNLGHRDFGENYVQELVEKEALLPKDIRWHFIGHLQTNKVKQIASFVHLIHAVDSYKLLVEINKQAVKNDRTIDVLLQLHIADEETKFGLNDQELDMLIGEYKTHEFQLPNVRICGLMGMATNTDDMDKIQNEFERLHRVFTRLADTAFNKSSYFSIRSMGMSSDYKTAAEAGSTMVRIGSMLFGTRG